MTEKITDVAVAVLLKADGSFLLSSRPKGKPYAGYWEFPGGKLEAGESVEAALKRELLEELGIQITHAQPWFSYIMRYTHGTVRLHAWRVRAWEGEIRNLEDQQFVFQQLAQLQTGLDVAPTLPGCVPIFNALKLPERYLITSGDGLNSGVSKVLSGVKKHLEMASVLLQVREPALSQFELTQFVRAIVTFKNLHHAENKNSHKLRILLNVGDAEALQLAQNLSVDGVQIKAQFLVNNAASFKSYRANFSIIGASVHDAAQSARAGELGCDFAVLGHVMATPSHPRQPALGWAKFADIAVGSPIPVFAIGGLGLNDMSMAQNHGAHGVAMIRAAWTA